MAWATGRGGDGAEQSPFAAGPHKIGGLPTGIGMWTWQRDQTEGGDVERIVARATGAGLTHLYVRTGDSRRGFYNAGFLDDLLPRAHQAGLKVYAWDFPDLDDPEADVERAVAAIEHEAPGGHRVDGFSADIETPSEGTQLTVDAARTYAEGLRAAVGPSEVLIATVPNPTEHFRAVFPYEAVVPSFDAVAPMVYWHARDPAADLNSAAAHLAGFGKPLLPIGQAYDGAPEGGPPGPPPAAEIVAFLDAAAVNGAAAVSFWSWQHASPEIWATLAARS
ncbi:MAG: hypothetical protein AB7L84_13880 [Acidimicrobiia bacterium]